MPALPSFSSFALYRIMSEKLHDEAFIQSQPKATAVVLRL